MAYRAEIEIGVKGAKKLQDFRSALENANQVLREVNEQNDVFGKPLQSLKIYQDNLKLAAENLNNVKAGIKGERDAVRDYLRAAGELNEFKARHNRLLEEEASKLGLVTQELREYNAATAAARQVGSMTGSYLRPGEAKLKGQSSPINPQASVQAARDLQQVREHLADLDAKSIKDHNTRLDLQADYLTLVKRTTDAAKFRAQQSPAPLALPAFQERGLQLLDNSVKANESQLRIETALNGQRQRGVRFLEKQTAEEKRQLDLGITGQRSNILPSPLKGQSSPISPVRTAAGARAATGFQIALPEIELDRQVALMDKINGAIEDQITFHSKITDGLKRQRAVGLDINGLEKTDTRLIQQQGILKQRELRTEEKIQAAIKRGLEEREKAERRRRKRQDALGSGIIGGAFPLLFGQGLGAAVGGGVGGAAGGLIGGQFGFGLSLVGTQFGTMIDQMVAKTAELGQALNETTINVDAVVEASGLANTEYANSIQQIKELSTEQEALRYATTVLAATVGTEGVQALRQFGSDTTNLANEFARAMTLMQSAFAKAFGGVAQGVAKILKQSNDLQAGLNLKTPEAKKLQQERTGIIQKSLGAAGKGSPIPRDPKELERLVTIENRLRELGAEAVQNAKDVATARASQLDGQQRLNALNLQDSKLSGLQLKNAKLKRDYTNADYANTERAILARQRELKIEEIKKGFTDKQTGQITNYRKVAEAIAQFDEQHLVKKAELETKISVAQKAADDKKIAANDRKIKQAERLAEQEATQLARAMELTASLQYQANSTQVAGSVEARRLQIQYEYEQTVARIAQLKNQDFAASQKALADQIKQNKLANLEAETERNKAKAIYDAASSVRRIREEHEASLVASKEYNRLLMEGMLPAEAKRVSEFNKQVASQLKQIDHSILLTEADITRADANGATTDKLRQQLDLLKQQRQEIEGEAAKGPGKSDTSDRKIIEDRVAQLKGEITEMTRLGNVVVKVADNIGSAFSTAFQSVLNGSKSTQQALSDMFKTVGESFVQMAAEIITKQLMMIALQSILKALGGASFDAAGTGQFAEQSNKVFDGSSLFSQGPVPFKANGGPVQAGQPYMVGERGPELFVPGTNGGVMRNDDMRQLMGRSPMGNSPQMNFSFETTSIGGQEFVSRDQLEAAMATTRRQAANDGAKRGMSMTLDKMQNSPRTRSRVGIR